MREVDADDKFEVVVGGAGDTRGGVVRRGAGRAGVLRGGGSGSAACGGRIKGVMSIDDSPCGV